MNLSELKFSVQTQELLDAKKAIDGIASSMHNLNKATADETKSAIENEKVKQAQAKTAKELANQLAAEERAKTASIRADRASEQSTKANVTILEKHNSIVEFMIQGFSRGQAATLQMAKAAGAAKNEIEELGKVLQLERKLTGASPFDKSMSGLVALGNQYGELREAVRQYNADSGLTSSQTRELARDKERIIERMKAEGKGFQEIRQAVREHNQAFVEAAHKVNSLISIEKEGERVAREKANALRYLENAQEKVNTLVATYTSAVSTGDAVTERSAAAVATYALKLKQAGIEGATAAKMLDSFSAKQKIIAAQEQKQREAYLTRAIIPQFSDIFVGLTTGQNPMTVALQQLPQIQDLFTLTGVKAQDTVKVIGNAASEMITRLKGTAIAVTQAIGMGFLNLGASALSAFSKVDPLSNLLSKYNKNVLDSGPPTREYASALIMLEKVSVLAGISIGAMVTLLAAFVVQAFKTANAVDKLNESVVLYGAKLGLTTDELVRLSNETGALTSTSNEVKGFFGELIKGGFSSKESLSAATKAAVELSNVTTLSLEEIAKKYIELEKDPVKALTKLGIETGLVTVETIKYIEQLVKQGDLVRANSEAVNAMANAHTKAAQIIRNEMSPLNKLWIDFKSSIDKAFSSLQQFATNGAIAKGLAGLGYLMSKLYTSAQKVSLVDDLFSFDSDKRSAAEARLKEINAYEQERLKFYSDIVNGKKQYVAQDAALNSQAVQNMDRYGNAVKDLKKIEDTLVAKGMSKQSYIAKKIQEIQAAAGSVLQLEDFRAAVKKFGDEWETANKKRKTSVSKEDNYFAQTLERISDLNIKATQTTEANSKAQQLFLDIVSSPLWAKFSESQRIRIAQLIEESHAIELSSNALKEQKKLREDILKIQTDYALSNQKDLDEINNKISLIGLTENEKTLLQAKLKVEQDRLATIQKINTEVAKSLATGNISVFDAEAQRISETNAANATAAIHLENLTAANQLLIEQSQSFEAGWSEAFAKYRSNLENTASLGSSVFNTLSNGFSQAFTDFATGTKTASQAFKAFAQTVIQELLRIMAQQIAMQAIGGLGGGGFGSLIGGLFSAFGAASGLTYGTNVFSQQSMMLAAQDFGIPFSTGGYTGPGGINEPAGTVHKGEIVWSQKDIARAGGVSVVESMRKGLNGYASGGYVGSSAPAMSNSGGISINVENYGVSKDFEVQQLSESQIRIIARDEAKTTVQRDTPNIVASQIKNPNSAISKSINQNTQAQRRR